MAGELGDAGWGKVEIDGLVPLGGVDVERERRGIGAGPVGAEREVAGREEEVVAAVAGVAADGAGVVPVDVDVGPGERPTELGQARAGDVDGDAAGGVEREVALRAQ